MTGHKIYLSNGNFVLVDAEDYDFLSQWKWKENKGRAMRNKHVGTVGNWRDGKRKDMAVLMHRVIMDAPKGMDVDHINGNALDNRRSNLRVCTHAQNRANSKRSENNTSGYKGVSWDKKSSIWYTSAKYKGKTINLGRFVNIIDAAKAYDEAVIKWHGEYARPNFGGI